MKVEEYQWVIEVAGMQIAIGPIVACLGIALFALVLKALIEWVILRWEALTPSQGERFLRKLLLYPVEISLIPAINTTAEIFGVSSAAVDSIASEIPLMKGLMVFAAWVIWDLPAYEFLSQSKSGIFAKNPIS